MNVRNIDRRLQKLIDHNGQGKRLVVFDSNGSEVSREQLEVIMQDAGEKPRPTDQFVQLLRFSEDSQRTGSLLYVIDGNNRYDKLTKEQRDAACAAAGRVMKDELLSDIREGKIKI